MAPRPGRNLILHKSDGIPQKGQAPASAVMMFRAPSSPQGAVTFPREECSNAAVPRWSARRGGTLHWTRGRWRVLLEATPKPLTARDEAVRMCTDQRCTVRTMALPQHLLYSFSRARQANFGVQDKLDGQFSLSPARTGNLPYPSSSVPRTPRCPAEHCAVPRTCPVPLSALFEIVSRSRYRTLPSDGPARRGVLIPPV